MVRFHLDTYGTLDPYNKYNNPYNTDMIGNENLLPWLLKYSQ
jgi:hypothetical protein